MFVRVHTCRHVPVTSPWIFSAAQRFSRALERDKEFGDDVADLPCASARAQSVSHLP
jgi:hypothetical protein